MEGLGATEYCEAIGECVTGHFEGLTCAEASPLLEPTTG